MKTKLIIRITIAVLLTGGMVGLNSCLDESWDFNKISDEILLTPGIAMPIADGSLSISDILSNFDSTGYVQEDENNLMFITYAQSLVSFPAADILNIPDQDFLEFFIESEVGTGAFWDFFPIGDTISFAKNQNGSFKFSNNERLDSIILKTGDLKINVSSSFQHSGLIYIASDNIRQNGVPFEAYLRIPESDGLFDTSFVVNLDNFKIFLDNSDPVNTYLPLDFELSLINSGNPINAGESCNLSLSLVDLGFSSVYGYFGNYNLALSNGEIVLDLFDIGEIAGKISFADPELALNVNNSYGLPVQIELADFRTYSEASNTTTNIVFDNGNTFDILAPGIDAVGSSVPTRIEINKDNCNIFEAIETFPNEFNYSVSANTNPLGPEETNNFITDSSSLDIDVEVIIPIYFKASDFAFEDTIAFDFEERFGTAVDVIETFILELDIKNGLPLEVDIQVYFKDENFILLDSMFVDERFLLPPSLDNEGIITEPAEFTKPISFDSAKLENIKTTKYMFIRATINAAGGDYVKFYSYYDIYFKIKLDASLNINTRDL